MTEMSYVSLTLWIIAIDVKGQCEQSPRDSTAPQTDREAVFVYSNAFKNNATTVAGFGHIVNLKGKKTFVHLNWRVLIPFVDRVFGHDMNPYSLWMKMFVIKSTCRSFSIISLYVLRNKRENHRAMFSGHLNCIAPKPVRKVACFVNQKHRGIPSALGCFRCTSNHGTCLLNVKLFALVNNNLYTI